MTLTQNSASFLQKAWCHRTVCATDGKKWTFCANATCHSGSSFMRSCPFLGWELLGFWSERTLVWVTPSPTTPPQAFILLGVEIWHSGPQPDFQELAEWVWPSQFGWGYCPAVSVNSDLPKCYRFRTWFLHKSAQPFLILSTAKPGQISQKSQETHTSSLVCSIIAIDRSQWKEALN